MLWGDAMSVSDMRSIDGGPECYSLDRWTGFALGTVSAEDARVMLQHAANCDGCGQTLKTAIAICQDDASEEISETPRSLTDPEFPRRMAAMLVQRSEKHGAPARAHDLESRWVWAAAAALIVTMASTVYWLMRDRDPGPMLAQAAAAHRRLPIRIPDAPWAPTSVERSAETSTPAMLAEAEAVILRKLEREPENSLLLRYRSRVEILRGRYRAAIAILSVAADDAKSRESVLVDLGTAWLAQGLASQKPDELQRAVGYLSEALELDSSNPVARFNRAIASERLSLLDNAEADWKLCLVNDSSSGWAGEARAGLERINQKKNSGAKH